MMIPKVVMQTNHTRPEPYVQDMIRERSPGWRYEFYDDAAVYKYLKAHPDAEFPDIEAKFRAMPTGAHRGDLFRYYYLYQQGGVFFDSDAMLVASDLTACLPSRTEFFTVASCGVPNTMFQGFLGCVAKHRVLHECLRKAYEVDPAQLVRRYHLLCEQMFEILQKEKKMNKKEEDDTIKIFEEKPLDWDRYCTYDPVTSRPILMHYVRTKQIPRPPPPPPTSSATVDIVLLALLFACSFFLFKE
jgi:hypothetical protein